jgi:hypothetical protein
MKPSSARAPRKPVSTARARNAALINQLATPGLGSLMTRRYFAGAGQLLLACAGFTLLMAWFIRVMVFFYSLATVEAPEAEPNLHHEWWQAGALLFAAGWLWALMTSLNLLRQARSDAERQFEQAGDQPPVIP